VKTLADINTELALLSEQAIEERIEEQYNEFLEEMYQLWELEQYAADSYDLDAIYYGEV
jgi:hypothetical protein